jgi:basic membrane lipoprotein Med (substrate-binding protein (PBP1-ABC) superfamily)
MIHRRRQTKEGKMRDRLLSVRTLVVAAVAASALIAASCGGEEVDEPAAGDGNGGDGEAALRIAVVAPSAPNDLAFTQSMVDALDAIKQDRPIEVAVSDNLFVVEDAGAAIRDYAREGYDLVIGHGSQYGASIEEIARDFPKVSFAWGTSSDTFGMDNVFAYTAASDQGAYAMGTMGSLLSESGVIGVVGPIEVGDAQLYVDGFKAGAEAEDPSVKVDVNYIGSFSDVALASEAAEGFVSAGADVMTGTAQMVVGAVGVAEENDVAWFGTQANQTSLAPELVVASQVYHWEVALSDMLDKIDEGTMGGESYEINLENEGLVIEFNDAFDLPEDVRARGEEVIQGIIDGSIETGVGA